ncbi:sensor domain-containing diguanylate cyclase [Neobacillus mesonae]|uniref:sensor domain-containing diguanylate cyclase n=1 Tax=Neobacillus mesonae TaxID=1193713 RepID=UPI00203E200E|nr:sensor domain-containing diguanylate cyclase [Neobacillus mesonae]MCM3568384.1 sensor domain-containing diguanylate cyclase [Neobacillus mesonae]
MEIKPQIKTAAFLMWILMVPAGLWFTYTSYPPQFSGNWLDLLAFLLLISLVAGMPIVINNMFIFLIQWVALAVFLKFGLFVEIIFAQVSLVVLLLRLKVFEKDQWFRYPLNLNMIFMVSFVSGVIYFALGGEISPNLSDNHNAIWLAFLYAIVSYLLNQIIITIHLYFIFKEPFLGKDFIVETITTFITLPIGIVLYILYKQVGLLALLFVGAPFISISIIFNLYYSSQKVNHYLQKAAEIGHQMAEHLHVDDVLNLFIEKLCEMLPVDYAYILELKNDELKLVRRMESGLALSKDMPSLKLSEGISGLVRSNRKALIFAKRKEWLPYANGYIPMEAESILSVPIERSQNLIGVLVLASKKKRAYEKYQLMILDILCSYFAVAMENARHYEHTKMQSEHCSLTKLYNYHYFESVLNQEFDKLIHFERHQLSLIILDIDHFKAINDTYGHQSGNEILLELACRLKQVVGDFGTVARYGGEEFVVLLPDSSKDESVQMAEQIRQAVGTWPFTLKQSLDTTQRQVKMTVSIGVATAPEDAEDALALVRHADRALYVGAKRAGRNRVAEYSSC